MITNRFLYLHIRRTGGHLIKAFFRQIDGLQREEVHPATTGPAMVRECKRLGLKPVPPSVVFIRNPYWYYVSMWAWIGTAIFVRKPAHIGDFKNYMTMIKEGSVNFRLFKPLTHHWNTMGADKAEFVGRFESLYDDIVEISRVYMPDLITPERALRILKSLPLFVPSRRRIAEAGQKVYDDWRNYYDDETRSWVEKWDAGLLERFGYEFAAFG